MHIILLMLIWVVSIVVLLLTMSIIALCILIWRIYGWVAAKELLDGLFTFMVELLIEFRDFLGVKNFKQSLRKNLKHMPMNYIFLFLVCKLVSNASTGKLIIVCSSVTIVWWLIKSIYSPEPYSGSKYTNLG